MEQFSLPIAKLVRLFRLYAVKLNPMVCGHPCENVRLNGLLVPLLGDCERVVPLWVADRVIWRSFT